MPHVGPQHVRRAKRNRIDRCSWMIVPLVCRAQRDNSMAKADTTGALLDPSASQANAESSCVERRCLPTPTLPLFSFSRLYAHARTLCRAVYARCLLTCCNHFVGVNVNRLQIRRRTRDATTRRGRHPTR